MCSVKLRHKDKDARCRLFVVAGDGPLFLGMPDIELLDILKIMCNVKGTNMHTGNLTPNFILKNLSGTIQGPKLLSK